MDEPIKPNPELLINPRMAWACPPSEQGRLKFIEGHGADLPTLPHEGDVLRLPFMCDPSTGEPVPVRVVQIQKRQQTWGHLMVIVVMRADMGH